jgi:small conductance mechanosensitive channel
MRLVIDPQQLADTCGPDPSWLCQQVLESTNGNEFLARSADFLLAKPAQIVLILLVAVVVNRLVRRAIRAFTERIAAGRARSVTQSIRSHTPSLLTSTAEHDLRASARANTVGTVLRSCASALIYTVAVLLILGEIGIDLAPLIAGAGIAGIAFGFGAQSLVKDFLSGVFMLIEDQYGVGDVIDAGDATGTVESVTLRSTRLRDVHGTVWHIPNGEIRRVGNKSQQWARALLDVPIAHGNDVRRAEKVIKQVADELWHSDDFGPKIIDEPEVWGVEGFGVNGIEIRLVIKTLPAEQWKVLRELRLRLNEAFERESIDLPAQWTGIPLTALQPSPAKASTRPAKAASSRPRTRKEP